MSYILEALKKADAERELGAVPDLHTHPSTPAASYPDATPRRVKAWGWLAAGSVGLAIAALVWQRAGTETPTMPPPPQAMPSFPPATPPAQQAMPPMPMPPVVPSPPPQPPVESPAVAVAPNVPPAAAVLPRVVPSAPAPRAEPKSSRVAPPAAARAGAPERVPPLAELPDDLRRQVPAIAIGGSVYAAQPASRMIIVNGQILREGEALTPELKVEQIGAKSAVFSIRGQRFEVPL